MNSNSVQTYKHSHDLKHCHDVHTITQRNKLFFTRTLTHTIPYSVHTYTYLLNSKLCPHVHTLIQRNTLCPHVHKLIRNQTLSIRSYTYKNVHDGKLCYTYTHLHDPKICPHVHTLTRSQTLPKRTHIYTIRNSVMTYKH